MQQQQKKKVQNGGGKGGSSAQYDDLGTLVAPSVTSTIDNIDAAIKDAKQAQKKPKKTELEETCGCGCC